MEGSHPVLFVHDEFVLEVPVADSERVMRALHRVMVEAMVSVMPGQEVRADGKVLVERWTK